MYQKYASAMTAFLLVLATAWFCVRGVEIDRYMAANTFGEEPIVCVEELLDYEKSRKQEQLERADSRQPVINVSVMERKPVYELNEQDYETLLQIVEAEAGSEDEMGKLLVANVVLNRVNSEEFPDTVTEVVYQRDGGYAQFSPVGNGSIRRVTVSEETVAAVERALSGEDVSQGALYFAARSAADPDNMRWFDTHLNRLFAYGGHEFFE